jgi:3-deoxy-manno-octulosonate cytidylyltransferase (CMP-KDO synthetase)
LPAAVADTDATRLKFLVAVPARLESSRLANKVLADIGGEPMLKRVLDGAARAQRVHRVVLCTDSDELVTAARTWGYDALMTSPDCTSGSERIASVCDRFDADIVINVQGDQPFVDAAIIDAMADVFASRTPTPEVVTPVYRMAAEKLHDPNAVKTVLRANGDAVYFSRSAVPHRRGVEPSQWAQGATYWGHVGMYGYRRDVLAGWSSLAPSVLEDMEKLEQLRLIDNGITISTYEIVPTVRNTLSVDVAADLELARTLAASAS